MKNIEFSDKYSEKHNKFLKLKNELYRLLNLNKNQIDKEFFNRLNYEKYCRTVYMELRLIEFRYKIPFPINLKENAFLIHLKKHEISSNMKYFFIE